MRLHVDDSKLLLVGWEDVQRLLEKANGLVQVAIAPTHATKTDEIVNEEIERKTNKTRITRLAWQLRLLYQLQSAFPRSTFWTNYWKS